MSLFCVVVCSHLSFVLRVSLACCYLLLLTLRVVVAVLFFFVFVIVCCWRCEGLSFDVGRMLLMFGVCVFCCCVLFVICVFV